MTHFGRYHPVLHGKFDVPFFIFDETEIAPANNARSSRGALRGKYRPAAARLLWLALLVACGLVSSACLSWMAQSGTTTVANVASREGPVVKVTPVVVAAPKQPSPYHEDARTARNFTVVISTYGDSLHNPCVVRQWLSLGGDVVSSIIVVWDDPDEQAYELVTRAVSTNFTIPIEFVTNSTASLNNRYLVHGRVKTAAVFGGRRHTGVQMQVSKKSTCYITRSNMLHYKIKIWDLNTPFCLLYRLLHTTLLASSRCGVFISSTAFW